MQKDDTSMVFHLNCGKNIQLSNGRQVAERLGDGYDHGVTFSCRPLHVEKSEIFQLRIEATEEKWAGSLRFGVTTYCPNDRKVDELRALTDLFNDKKNIERFWIWAGRTIHQHRKETQMDFNMHSLAANDVVGLQVRSNGELYFFLLDKHVKVASDLPVEKNLYVVFDVYGSTKRVSYALRGGTLKELCKKAILTTATYEKINALPLPRILKCYLQDSCPNVCPSRKRKGSVLDDGEPNDKIERRT